MFIKGKYYDGFFIFFFMVNLYGCNINIVIFENMFYLVDDICCILMLDIYQVVCWVKIDIKFVDFDNMFFEMRNICSCYSKGIVVFCYFYIDVVIVFRFRRGNFFIEVDVVFFCDIFGIDFVNS